MMLFQYNADQASQIIQRFLTASQQSILSKQGLLNARSFLLLKPLRYLKRQYSISVNDLPVGQVACLVGKVRFVSKRQVRRNLIVFQATLQTEYHEIPLVWFNQRYILEKLKNDPWVVVYGKLDETKISTAFHVSNFETYSSLSQTEYGQVVPWYPDIRGVSNRILVSINRKLLSDLIIQDLLPPEVARQEGLCSILDAFQNFHFPSQQLDVAKSIQRFAFDELFLYLFPRRYRHKNTKVLRSSFFLDSKHAMIQDYFSRLPYRLTNAQQRVWDNICTDLNDRKTVFRLIQGDVGSGKTDIAILSLLVAVANGYKAAILVPTEILAEQHFLKLKSRCSSDAEIFLLKGKQTKKEREKINSALQGNDALIVVGTHALVQDGVNIKDLAMVIIDEQHRFGVFQRQTLLEKSTHVPHCLFMSATPIPRTLMLTHYGDLDHDVIDELPPGRKPPKTYYASPNRLNQLFGFIRLELQAKRQVYVVYPLIETSDHLEDVLPAVDGFDLFSNEFAGYSVGLLHGKMPNQDKQAVMDRFKNNDIQILVSTTVIEVGVDVPNASTMVIMNAERFGLSQLHQLRGRVGRGKDQSHCFLIANAKSLESRQRIKAMQASSNGFDLAEEDLKIRGPGNVLGTQQSGELLFSFTDLSQKDLIQRIVTICDVILKDPDQFAPLLAFFEDQKSVSSVLLN